MTKLNLKCLTTLILFVAFNMTLVLPAIGQDESRSVDSQSEDSLNGIPADGDSLDRWFQEQVTPGVTLVEGQLIVDDEAKRVRKDTAYAAWIYNRDIGMSKMRDALAAGKLRLAFWFAVDYYAEHEEVILPILMSYDRVFPVDKILNAGYQTYVYFDPRITEFNEGIPTIKRPDLLEQRLHETNDVIMKVISLRKDVRK